MTVEYWVYRNWTNKRGRVHLGDCGYCQDGSGAQRGTSDKNGDWTVFSNWQGAHQFLLKTEYSDIACCSVCLDGRQLGQSFEANSLWKNQAFTISHADDGKFVGQGLRAFFEYRDLGIDAATQGKFGAHVIRAVPGMESPGAWHSHELDFQMVYVTKGWVVFEYEGQGEHVLREGSCVLQPPGIKHREVRHSDDMELIEITSPSQFDTRDESAP